MQATANAFYQWGSAHGSRSCSPSTAPPRTPNDPGRRAQWLRDTDATFRGWANLRAVAYFDSVGSCDSRLGADETAFREPVQTAYANGAPSAWLRASPFRRTGAPHRDLQPQPVDRGGLDDRAGRRRLEARPR